MHQEWKGVPVGSVSEGVEPLWCVAEVFLNNFAINSDPHWVFFSLVRGIDAAGPKHIADALMRSSSLTQLDLSGVPPSRYVLHSHWLRCSSHHLLF